MTSLALLGGAPRFEQEFHYKSFWPPVDTETDRSSLSSIAPGIGRAFHPTEHVFAQAFAAHHDTRHGTFMVNGTVTLQCALAAHGIGAGDEVIVPPFTWYATAIAVCHVGARPVFVDVERDTLCIDPEKIEAAITKRTKAIIPVHAYGSMADMDRIMAIARRRGLKVIEDCAHMHGGIWDGKHVGSIGDVGSFSFQHGKTMSSGEGGICITTVRRLPSGYTGSNILATRSAKCRANLRAGRLQDYSVTTFGPRHVRRSSCMSSSDPSTRV